MWVISPNLRIKVDKRLKSYFWGQNRFSARERETIERKRVEREAPTSLYNLWSPIARYSSAQELKYIYTMRATRGYQKQRISPKIQAKSLGDRGFRVSKTSKRFIFAPRGRDSSYFDLFSILGAI